jgi:hypothetical protein
VAAVASHGMGTVISAPVPTFHEPAFCDVPEISEVVYSTHWYEESN